MSIIKDQEKFFNEHSLHEQKVQLRGFFNRYVNKEQVNSLKWISDCKIILEYGCGTGTSLDVFFNKRNRNKYTIFGVDIAARAIEKAKERYPEFVFYKISNNKMPQIKNNSLDAAFMFHVLHHTNNYLDIFKEINAKLKKGGKFLINDLSSNNPINKTARSLFLHMPFFVKNKFGDDLVVGESIPEKNKVDLSRVVKQLGTAGFIVEEIGYGHLFFFVFGWIEMFIPLSGFSIVRSFYKRLWRLEDILLQKKFFQSKSELFYIKAIKK